MTSANNTQLLLTSTFINMCSKNTEFPKISLRQCPLLPAFCPATQWCRPRKECAHKVVYACTNTHKYKPRGNQIKRCSIFLSKGSSGLLWRLSFTSHVACLHSKFPLRFRGFLSEKNHWYVIKGAFCFLILSETSYRPLYDVTLAFFLHVEIATWSLATPHNFTT